MKRERGRARENVHVMRLPAEQLKVKCRVSLAVLGHPTERRMSTGVLVRKHGTSEGANHSHDILCMWDIVRDFSIGSLKSRVDARASANCSPKGLLQMPLQHIHISCVTYIHSSNVFRLANS